MWDVVVHSLADDLLCGRAKLFLPLLVFHFNGRNFLYDGVSLGLTDFDVGQAYLGVGSSLEA